MNMEFIEAIHELEKERGISAEVLFDAIEAALISAYKKNFVSMQNVKATIDRQTGKIKVFAYKAIVETVEDEKQEISLVDAQKINPTYTTDDMAEFEVTPGEFGRIAAQTAKQVVVQRIREAERGMIYDAYINREGDIVTGVVQRYEQRNLIIDLGKVEAIIPASEQIPGEICQPFDRVKAYVVEVKNLNKGPQILLSRTHPGLIRRLFELEVPEIHDGIVEIKSVAREAGSRSKIAVCSNNSNVDPVGACVGQRGNRVQVIVNELHGEKMDIIPWSADPVDFIYNALSPAKALGVYPKNEDYAAALVVVPDHQLSLAIGREGQNARLAAKITGWKIDIKSESQARNQSLYPEEYLINAYQEGYFDEEPDEPYDGYYDEGYEEEGYEPENAHQEGPEQEGPEQEGPEHGIEQEEEQESSGQQEGETVEVLAQQSTDIKG
ncbi:MAG: transcription termination factor NusA [Peptococcaceae bacterium]|nr:transcription termination factor NusA [Peptococcaceae bacterium]